jgi:hypothetical protein
MGGPLKGVRSDSNYAAAVAGVAAAGDPALRQSLAVESHPLH